MSVTQDLKARTRILGRNESHTPPPISHSRHELCCSSVEDGLVLASSTRGHTVGHADIADVDGVVLS